MSLDPQLRDALEDLKGATMRGYSDLKDRVDSLEVEFRRPRGLGDDAGSLSPVGASNEYKALGGYALGDESGFSRYQGSLSTDVDPAGGYVVYPNFASTIRSVQRDTGAMTALAYIQTIETGDGWYEPVELDDDWEANDVGESQARPETASGELGLDHTPLNEVYANAKATQKLLDLSQRDIGQWVESKMADRFVRKENYNYIAGDGVGRAKGLLSYPVSTQPDFVRPRATWQYVPSGGATSITPDALRDCYWSLRAPFRANATWLMASATANMLDKLKDTANNYLWRDSSASGVPPTLLGRPVAFDENMPSASVAGAYAIAFADFKRAYIIVEKPGLRLLRDPFTAKPHVMIYGTKRSGGGMRDSHACKILRIGTG